MRVSQRAAAPRIPCPELNSATPTLARFTYIIDKLADPGTPLRYFHLLVYYVTGSGEEGSEEGVVGAIGVGRSAGCWRAGSQSWRAGSRGSRSSRA